MTHHTTTLSLSIGGDTPTWEGEVTVTYEVTPYRPAQPPTYDRGWIPEDWPEVVNIQVTHIEGREADLDEAVTLADWIDNDEKLMAILLDRANGD